MDRTPQWTRHYQHVTLSTIYRKLPQQESIISLRLSYNKEHTFLEHYGTLADVDKHFFIGCILQYFF